MKMRKLLTLTSSLFLLTSPLFAWGAMGHRIVAEVAYHYLSSQDRQSIDQVLGTHGIVYWATWPDEIKSDKNIYSTAYDWHFQDLPADLSSSQLQVLRHHYPSHGGHLWTTLDQLLTQLPEHPDTLLVNGVSLPYHNALVFLIHCTADELCPMHMAHEEDKGGNDVKVIWKGSETNLHKVWDEKIIESRGYSYSEYAQMLIDTYDQERPAITQMTEQEFVNYIYTTTQSIYLDQAEHGVDHYTYMWRWKITCDRLLFMAGIRLANNIAYCL